MPSFAAFAATLGRTHSNGTSVRFAIRALGLLLLLLLAPACGITGSTSTFVVDVRAPNATGPIAVKSVELEPDQSKLVNVGTYAWGKYGAGDLDVLTRSMKQSAASLAGPSPLEVHVVLRRFLVATGGSDGIAIACVSWALAMPDGQLVFHEQFYASRHVNTFGTVGGIKDTVHEAIARRVLGRAAAIASAPGTSGYERVRPEHTFDTYEESLKGLPSTLTGVSMRVVQLGDGYHYYSLQQGASASAELAWVRKPDHLDWPARLAKR